MQERGPNARSWTRSAFAAFQRGAGLSDSDVAGLMGRQTTPGMAQASTARITATRMVIGANITAQDLAGLIEAWAITTTRRDAPGAAEPVDVLGRHVRESTR